MNKSKSRKRRYLDIVSKLVYRYSESDTEGIKIEGVITKDGDTVPFALFLQSLCSKRKVISYSPGFSF